MPSDRERYSDAIDRCRALARASTDAQRQQLWTSVADTYRCLYENEVRAEAMQLIVPRRVARNPDLGDEF